MNIGLSLSYARVNTTRNIEKFNCAMIKFERKKLYCELKTDFVVYIIKTFVHLYRKRKICVFVR